MWGLKVRRTVKHAKRLSEDVLAYAKLTFAGRKVQRLTDFKSCQRPVLLVYGFGATRRIFSILEKRLRKDGYCVFSVHLGGFLDTFNTGGIEQAAAVIKGKLDKLMSLYELGPLSIIGHSKGGLIAEYYVKHYTPRRVFNLITLATPHNGTPWALLGLFSPLALVSKSIRQMWPMAPFIRELSQMQLPEQVHMVSMYSKDDGVCPYPCCRIDIEGRTNIKNIEIDDTNHTEFVISRRVYEHIHAELQAGLRRAPGCKVNPESPDAEPPRPRLVAKGS